MNTPHSKTPENEYAARILRTAKQANDMHVFDGFNLTMSRVQAVCAFAQALVVHIIYKAKF
jgi:hypothetical protein